jgi:molybdopterin-guanine dinucleotide biosynthesis protein A
MMRSGLLLAGGQSRRMGTDKALLEWRGQPLALHAAAAMRPWVGEMLLAGPAERYASLGFRCCLDAFADGGPMAGVHAGLKQAAGALVLVSTCDAPLVSEALWAFLLERLEPGDEVLCARAAGQLHPLVGLYRRHCWEALEEGLRQGERRATALLERLDARAAEVPDALVWQLANLNTPADFDRLRAEDGGK